MDDSWHLSLKTTKSLKGETNQSVESRLKVNMVPDNQPLMTKHTMGKLRWDFKLILWSRSMIGWRSRTRYLIGWGRYLASISLKTLLSSNCEVTSYIFRFFTEIALGVALKNSRIRYKKFTCKELRDFIL